MRPETVDALLEELKSSARALRAALESGDKVLMARAHLRLAAVAWADAESRLQTAKGAQYEIAVGMLGPLAPEEVRAQIRKEIDEATPPAVRPDYSEVVDALLVLYPDSSDIPFLTRVGLAALRGAADPNVLAQQIHAAMMRRLELRKAGER